MSIAIESNEVQLQKLRERLRLMSDEELIKFGKMVRGLSGRRNWKRRVRSGGEDTRKRSDICARSKLEEGGFPGFIFRGRLVLEAYARYVRLSIAAPEVLLLPRAAPYQREALLRDSRSLWEDSRSLWEDSRSLWEDSRSLREDSRSLREDSRSLWEDSRSLCERERSVVRPMFAESGSKNRLSQASQR